MSEYWISVTTRAEILIFVIFLLLFPINVCSFLSWTSPLSENKELAKKIHIIGMIIWIILAIALILLPNDEVLNSMRK